MPVLVAQGLMCRKQDRILFQDVNFELRAGELVYLRGPNGAGKTSFLRILTGLSRPEKGDVIYAGMRIQTDPQSYYQQLLYVGHKAGLNLAFTALENLTYWAAQHQVACTQDDIYTVLGLLGLTGVEDVPVRGLSAGQTRRVALARLWLKPAKVWILDEPFTALDVDAIALLERKMAQHVSAGGAILTTSHQALSNHAGAYREVYMEYQF